MDMTKRRARVQEELLSLYLRLNGYFVTSFIVHSPIYGRNLTELDVMAVRFPHSVEPERQVGADPLLELSNEHTDLVICEVKSRGQQLQFNDALVRSCSAFETLLRWAGLFPEPEVKTLAPQLQAALTPSNPPKATIPTVVGPRHICVRGFLCSPELNNRRSNQAWFISGPDMFNYIWQCLCPPTQRSGCATVYDFGCWGEYEHIVRYFKERSVSASGPGTMKELYSYLEEAN